MQRFKTVAVVFYISGHARKKKMCQLVIDSFKIRARLTTMHWLFFLLFINYYMLIVIQLAQWQGISVLTTMTWVQVPGLAISHIIFHVKVPCSAHTRAYHALQNQLIHVSQGAWSRVQLEECTIHQVNKRAYDWKSPQNCQQMGQTFRPTPPNFKATPPWFYLFFFFLIFFIFYYF